MATLKKDIYKDEFGQYYEVDEEVETPIDGFEDEEHDQFEEDDLDIPFDSAEDENDKYYDEDEAYINEQSSEYDSEED